VAIDASLGSRRHQGYITIGNGAIRPGAGAGKTLPEVGDIFITGIVNVSGSFEQLLLQTTRLATIFHMAESISQGILLACRELEAAGTSELLL
ncbi:MAG TPA: spore protease YyaC, partial [Fusicatenibacter saccharivorans]|nr:spore protease YyaC [Fusicatenibacter saccharivorans]